MKKLTLTFVLFICTYAFTLAQTKDENQLNLSGLTQSSLDRFYQGFSVWLIDVNGDKIDDLLYVGNQCAVVHFGKSLTEYNLFGMESCFGHANVYSGYKRYLEDINGDGIKDLVFIGVTTSYAHVGAKDGTFFSDKIEHDSIHY